MPIGDRTAPIGISFYTLAELNGSATRAAHRDPPLSISQHSRLRSALLLCEAPTGTINGSATARGASFEPNLFEWVGGPANAGGAAGTRTPGILFARTFARLTLHKP